MEQFFASLSFVGDANIQFNPMTAVVMIDDDDSKFPPKINNWSTFSCLRPTWVKLVVKISLVAPYVWV